MTRVREGPPYQCLLQSAIKLESPSYEIVTTQLTIVYQKNTIVYYNYSVCFVELELNFVALYWQWWSIWGQYSRTGCKITDKQNIIHLFSSFSSVLPSLLTGYKSDSSSSESLKDPLSSEDFLCRFLGEWRCCFACDLSFFFSLWCLGDTVFSVDGDSVFWNWGTNNKDFSWADPPVRFSCTPETDVVALCIDTWCICNLLGFFVCAVAAFFSLCFILLRWNRQKSVINHVQITSIVEPTMMLTRTYFSRPERKYKKISQ